MDLELTGKVALVTGASRGLGRAIAVSLAREGCRLALVARGEAALRAVADALPASAQAVTIAADITLAQTADRLRDAVLQAFGRCDILVNNAGGSRSQPDLGSDAVWQEAMLLNFESGRRLAHRLIPDMQAQGFGRILNLTGQDEPRDINPANAPNGAVHIWAKGISRVLARDGITVNSIAPGRLHSEQMDRRILDTPEKLAQAAREIPAGYVGQPEDLSCLATFLCSPLARYITGQVIHVDGGARRFSH